MLQQQFKAHFASTFGFVSPKNTRFLLAVSGGVDSVVLCHLMHQAGFNFVIAHCNFQLRGPESHRDEQFVKNLSERYQKPLLLKRFNTTDYAEQNKLSVQVAARELRYNWFNQFLDNGALQTAGTTPMANEGHLVNYIVTAHHANDNIETLLMNFFKGTGIAGLHGILPVQGKILRPLLPFKKQRLVEWARHMHLSFVEDSSNTSDKYTRNYFRHQVLPLVQQVFPQAEDNLLSNIARFAEIELLYQQQIAGYKKKLLVQQANEIHIPVLLLQKQQPLQTIVYEIVKAFGFSAGQVKDVVALLDSDTGRWVQSPSHRIIKNRGWLIIAPHQNQTSEHLVIDAGEKRVHFSGGQLVLDLGERPEHFAIPASAAEAWLNPGAIQFPLLLRRWKTGDYFYPLGMKKKKKLSRFFIDLKLSKTQKEQVWVLEMNKKIVWVVGWRVDDRFKVLPNTQKLLSIKLIKE